MSRYVIDGGHSLEGRIRPAGNKNAALPILAGCLLTEERVRLSNVPDIRDVHTMIDLMQHMGAEVEWTGEGELGVEAASLEKRPIPEEMAGRIRASILLAGPLLARFGELELPPPGGDVIGRRRVDTHFLALGRLGADVEAGQTYVLRAKELKGTEIFLDEPSVTGTENAILASALAEGTTRLRNAAREPHVQDLCGFLDELGASIDGVGTHELRIHGVDRLGGGEHRVCTDHVEVGSLVGLAAVTDSEITIEEEQPGEYLDTLRIGFETLGVTWSVREEGIHVPDDQEMEIQRDLGDQIPKVDDGPWPAFPADLMSIALVVATQCRGTVLIHEKMFESRMFFVDKLVSMGARIVLCDPHRAVVIGPARLYGSELESPDIRAGMALLLAAMAADGRSEIHNIRQIERGYENLEARLRDLGARIERREGPS